MKKIKIVLLIMTGLCLSLKVSAQTSNDSLMIVKISSLDSDVKKLQLVLSNQKSDTTKANTEKEKHSSNCQCKLNGFDKFLLLFPFVVGILFTIWIIYRLRKDNFSLSVALCYNPFLSSLSSIDRLKEIDPTKLYLYNYPSSTRLIAFLSGFITIIIAFSIAIYSSYAVMCNREIPDYNHLISVFGALGLGIIPYGINRWTSKKDETKKPEASSVPCPVPPIPGSPVAPVK